MNVFHHIGFIKYTVYNVLNGCCFDALRATLCKNVIPLLTECSIKVIKANNVLLKTGDKNINKTLLHNVVSSGQVPHFLTLSNFNPSVDKQLHPIYSVG